MQHEDLKLRSLRADDFKPYVALHNAVYPRRTRTVEELRRVNEARDPRLAFGRWAAFAGTQFVGFAGYAQWAGETYKDWVQLNVVVDKAFRRRGIGTMLYERVVKDVRESGLAVLRADAYEDLPSGLPFARSLGFTDVFREGPSHLNLDGFSAAPFMPLLDRLEGEGVEFLSYAQLRERDSNFANALFAACRNAWHDVPKEHETDLLRADWDAGLAQEPGLDFDISTVALEEEAIVGFCEVWSAPKGRPVYAGLAGVERAARGRGIATAAYVRAIEAARRKGHPQMQTSSAIENIAMQIVYAKLGFIREPVWIQLEKRLVPNS